ncbi:MAG: hypothetical protein ACT443_09730 [Gemmatimonadota bacterium]
MTFMTDQQRRILERLIQIAGSPLLVDEAFAELSRTKESFTLEDVVAYILENRDAFHASMESAGHRRTENDTVPA